MALYTNNSLILKLASGWAMASTDAGVEKYSEYPDRRATISFGSPKCATLSCYIAANNQLQTRGLQGFEKIGKSEGVLFPFSSAKTATFHMGDVKFPIDIIFIGGDGRVNKIVENAQPGSKEKWAMGRVAAVVEANAGFCAENDVKVGSELVYVASFDKTAQAGFPNHPRKDINPRMEDLSGTDPADRFKDRDLIDKQVDHQPMDGNHYEQTNGYDVVTYHDDDSAPALRPASKVNKMSYFDEDNRAKRRAARQAKYSTLANAFKKSASKLTRQNLGTNAVQFISDYLSEYRLPGTPRYSYSAARVAESGSDHSQINDGLITISASMKTGSAIRVDFDIPIQIRAGKFLDPSIILVNGAPRVISQSTFDDLSTTNSTFDIKSERGMYSPPDPAAQHVITRRPGIGMFNTDRFRQIISSGLYRSAGFMDEALDPAEDHASRICPGPAKLKKSLEVRDRGGVMHEFGSGSKIEVLRDQAGDGKSCVVRFENGLEAIVDADCIE